MAIDSSDAHAYRRLLNMALRSRVRRLTLWTYMNSLYPLSVSEVCRKTRLYPNEISGVIRGRKGSYEPKYSLKQLHLLDEVRSKGRGGGRQKTYKFTNKDPALLKCIEDILKGYRDTGEL